MKIFLFIFSFSLFQTTWSQDLSVMTFNIRLQLESDKENAWTERKLEVVELLNFYHPDVLGVQEALPQQMQDIHQGIQNYSFVGVGRDDGKNKGEYSAIFYNHEKFIVHQSGTFWLSETPQQPSMGWDAAYPRICTYALFENKKDGKKFWAFNVHFDHVGDVARENSSKLILQKMTTLNSLNYPIVLTGDFNLTEDKEPIKIIAKKLNNSYYHTLKPAYGPYGTFTAFNVNEIPKDRIDYIFTKGFSVLTHQTIDDRRRNLLYPSDHFPIMVTLNFKE